MGGLKTRPHGGDGSELWRRAFSPPEIENAKHDKVVHVRGDASLAPARGFPF